MFKCFDFKRIPVEEYDNSVLRKVINLKVEKNVIFHEDIGNLYKCTTCEVLLPEHLLHISNNMII